MVGYLSEPARHARREARVAVLGHYRSIWPRLAFLGTMAILVSLVPFAVVDLISLDEALPWPILAVMAAIGICWGIGYQFRRRDDRVTTVLAEGNSALGLLLHTCMHDPLAPVAEAAAECLIRRSPKTRIPLEKVPTPGAGIHDTDCEPVGLEEVATYLLAAWAASEQLSENAQEDTRHALLEVAKDMPSTAETVKKVRTSLLQLGASILDGVDAEDHLHSAVERPVIEAQLTQRLQDQEVEALRAKARIQILTDQLRETTDRVRVEAQVSQTVADEMSATSQGA